LDRDRVKQYKKDYPPNCDITKREEIMVEKSKESLRKKKGVVGKIAKEKSEVKT